MATPELAALPCILADAASATLLYLITAACHRRHAGTSNPSTALQQLINSGASALPSPATLAGLLLWNPLLITTAAAASTASLALTAVLFALYGGVTHRPVVAAVGTAAAVYLRPHNVLFTVPLSLMLVSGVEDVTAEPTAAALAAAYTVAAADEPPPKRPRQPSRVAGGAVVRLALFWTTLLASVAALVVLSDKSLEVLHVDDQHGGPLSVRLLPPLLSSLTWFVAWR